MPTIVERVNAQRAGSIYQAAADRFNTTYRYVWQIAAGKRQATRGKGREIKEWLESQLNK